MWASGHNGDIRRAAHGYEATREAAMHDRDPFRAPVGSRSQVLFIVPRMGSGPSLPLRRRSLD